MRLGVKVKLVVLRIGYGTPLNGVWRFDSYKADAIEQAPQMARVARLNSPPRQRESC